MSLRSLQVVLRSLAEAEPTADDAELLRDFVGGEEAAFAELVRRHGRRCWPCAGTSPVPTPKPTTPSRPRSWSCSATAEDPRCRAALGLAARRGLQGLRKGAARRPSGAPIANGSRPSSERNGSAVADSTWDRALAAVHEEAGKLPETLPRPVRAVLPGRQGRDRGGRATRVEARHPVRSAHACQGRPAGPARSPRADHRCRGRSRAGDTAGVRGREGDGAGPGQRLVPESVLQLTQGVIGMSLKSAKLLAAAVLLTCGLGLGVGTGWMANADAQGPGGQPPVKANPADEVKRLEAELERPGGPRRPRASRSSCSGISRSNWPQQSSTGQVGGGLREDGEVGVRLRGGGTMTQAKFVEFLQDRENRGWEFNGTTMLQHEGKPTSTWVFRRPPKGTAGTAARRRTACSSMPTSKGLCAKPERPERGAAAQRGLQARCEGGAPRREGDRSRDRPAASEASHAANQPGGRRRRKRICRWSRRNSPRFSRNWPRRGSRTLDSTITPSSTGLVVEGDKEVLEWAGTLVKKLSEK